MNFSVGSKSLLAKLMSEEDIRVEHKQIETAYFDVVNRVLALTMWKDMSSDLYDLLVGHEVGHALYTCLLYTSPSPRDRTTSRMPSSA